MNPAHDMVYLGDEFSAPVDIAMMARRAGLPGEKTPKGILTIGYLEHDREKVRLYIQESFTFRVLTAHAAVPLVYGKKAEAKRRG